MKLSNCQPGTKYWLPEVGMRGFVVIVHGMAEHALRYGEFAQYLNSNGYGAGCFDMMGHGPLTPMEKLGIMDRNKMLDNIEAFIRQCRKQYSEHIILMGHSMGSLLVRDILTRTKQRIDRAIISGTPGPAGFMENMGLLLAKAEKWRLGAEGRTHLMWNMTFGDYNRHFKPNRTMFDWLSRDEAEVDKYDKDPYCGFVCSAQFYVDLIQSVKKLSSVYLNPVNRDTDMLFISGGQDPVCNFGKGSMDIAQRFENAGYSSITRKVYTDARHELLHEINRNEVFTYIVDWLGKDSINRKRTVGQ